METKTPDKTDKKRIGKTDAIALPSTFQVRFWEVADGRFHAIKLVRKRVRELKQDCGCDSMQKDLLCQRVVFLSLQLEAQERAAAEGGEFNAGVYTQQLNCLLGILKALGLEKRMKKVGLSQYIAKDQNEQGEESAA